jgi:alkanesulfonate monooxygenase SsuD/methylene tetrahydromethanopterin reductase-like flavin-dependent oxidoreductase (luciferase family)
MTAVYAKGGYCEPEELLELAPLLEELGFDGVTMPDHLFLPDFPPGTYPYTADGELPFRIDAPWADPWVTIGALAAVTKTLRFVT